MYATCRLTKVGLELTSIIGLCNQILSKTFCEQFTSHEHNCVHCSPILTHLHEEHRFLQTCDKFFTTFCHIRNGCPQWQITFTTLFPPPSVRWRRLVVLFKTIYPHYSL